MFTPVLSVREAAALVGVSERTIYRWCAEGTIESIRIGGTRRVLTLPFFQTLAGHRAGAGRRA
jgi:excisionase family DNA binding protein